MESKVIDSQQDDLPSPTSTSISPRNSASKTISTNICANPNLLLVFVMVSAYMGFPTPLAAWLRQVGFQY